MSSILMIVVSAVLTDNFVLSKFLGICPFLGVSKRLETAAGMGVAVVFVMTLASLLSASLYQFVLVPLAMEYLQTLGFILVIAALVQFVEIVLRKVAPPLYQALGIYLPLITTNCAVLGVALLNTSLGYDLGESTLYGFAAGLGFTLALILFSGVREKVEHSDIPDALKGIPSALIAAALVSVSFFGFQGLFAS